MRGLVFVLFSLIAACSPSENGVDLTIVAPALLSDATLMRAKSLTVTASGTRMGTQSYAVAGLLRETRLVIDTTASAGPLDIAVSVTAGEGLVIASGMGEVPLMLGRVPASITLTAPSLAVSPTAATVTEGRTQVFSANLPVTWSVTEADGGTIDANGIYTAPLTGAGPFHVIATSQASADLSVGAVVMVAPPGITLLAGALGGLGGAPGVGPNARVYGIRGMARIGDTFYLADIIGMIYKLTPPATLEIVAGRPFEQVDAVDGVGSDATFVTPRALVADAANNVIYVAGGGPIRKIDLSTNTVTSIGTDSPGGSIGGIVLAGSTLYISVEGASVIRSVSLPDGAVADVAGAAQQASFLDAPNGLDARFNAPAGLALDQNGTTLYVADGGNHRIRAVELSGMFPVTTVAGTGIAGCDDTNPLSRPSGLWNDGVGLFIADPDSHTVRKMFLSNHTFSTVAGVCNMSGTLDGIAHATTSAAGIGLLAAPLTAVPRDTGEFFIGEMASATVRFVNAQNQLRSPIGLALNSGTSDGIGNAARFGSVNALATDGQRVFVADVNSVRAVDPAGVVSTLVGVAGQSDHVDGDATMARLRSPQSLAWDGVHQRLIINDGATVRVWDDRAHTLSTLAGADMVNGAQDGTGGAARFLGIFAVAVDDAGETVYVNDIPGDYDTGDALLRRVRLSDGKVDTIAGSSLGGPLADGALGTSRVTIANLAWANGALYEVETAIRKWDPATGILTTIAGSLTETGTTDGMAGTARLYSTAPQMSAGGGALFLDDLTTIRKFALATSTLTRIVGTFNVAEMAEGPLPGTLNSGAGVVVLASGDLVVGGTEAALMKVRFPAP